MGAKYKGLSPVGYMAEIIALLQEKNLITEIKYQTTDCLIFTTPLSSKVIKITNTFILEYGDAWTSGATITNPVSFMYSLAGATIHMVCDTTFFALVSVGSGNGNEALGYVGALDNGDQLVMGMTNVPSWASVNICKDMTHDQQLYPIGFNTAFADADGNVLTYDLNMIAPASGFLKMNDLVPAKVVGLKLASSILDATTVTATAIRAKRNMATSNSVTLPNNLILPFTES